MKFEFCSLYPQLVNKILTHSARTDVLTEKLELLQPDLQKKDLSGCFEAACEEFGGDFFHFYPFLG